MNRTNFDLFSLLNVDRLSEPDLYLLGCAKEYVQETKPAYLRLSYKKNALIIDGYTKKEMCFSFRRVKGNIGYFVVQNVVLCSKQEQSLKIISADMSTLQKAPKKKKRLRHIINESKVPLPAAYIRGSTKPVEFERCVKVLSSFCSYQK